MPDVIIPNLCQFRKHQNYPEVFRLIGPADLEDYMNDASYVRLKVGNETMTGLYVDATCEIIEVTDYDSRVMTRVRWWPTGEEFNLMTFTDEVSEHRLRAIFWMCDSSGYLLPFPKEEGFTFQVAADVDLTV